MSHCCMQIGLSPSMSLLAVLGMGAALIPGTGLQPASWRALQIIAVAGRKLAGVPCSPLQL